MIIEFKHIFLSQIMIILFLIGLALGSTIQETKIIKSPPPIIYPYVIIEQAKKYHGTLLATKENGKWFFINKQGKPCSLFIKK